MFTSWYYALRGHPCCSADLQHEMKSVWCLWCVWRGFFFSEDGQPCIIDYKTLLQSYFISQALLTISQALFSHIFFVKNMYLFYLLCGFACVTLSPFCHPPPHHPLPFSYLLCLQHPVGGLIVDAQTAPLSLHPSAQRAGREMHKTKRQR